MKNVIKSAIMLKSLYKSLRWNSFYPTTTQYIDQIKVTKAIFGQFPQKTSCIYSTIQFCCDVIFPASFTPWRYICSGRNYLIWGVKCDIMLQDKQNSWKLSLNILSDITAWIETVKKAPPLSRFHTLAQI